MGYVSKLKYRFPKRFNIAVVGCGNRARDFLVELQKLDMNIHIAAICDLRGSELLAELQEMGLDVDGIKLFQDVDVMLDTISLDGIILGTRSDTHVPIAIRVLERNIPLLIEKPITQSMSELIALRDAYAASEKRVLVSFPLRTSPMAELVREIVESGKLGTVEHVQAFNYVPYGGVYYHNWYREGGIGSMFFEKTTHDFDYLNYLLGLRPVEVMTMTSQRVFSGSYPADKRCPDCEEQLTCRESPFYQKNFAMDNPQGEMCAFSENIRVHDSAGVLIRYESGLHVNYAENFFARKGAAARGARLSGYRGTLDFDWYTNQITVHMHHTPRVDTYRFDDGAMGHFGGDRNLIMEFARMMSGAPAVGATLDAGFVSTLMCFAAQESAVTRRAVPILWGDEREEKITEE